MENPEGCLMREGKGKASKARKSTVLLATKKPVKNSPLDWAKNPYMPCQEQFDDTRSHGWRGKWELLKQSAGISSKKSGCGEVRGKSGTKEDRGSRKAYVCVPRLCLWVQRHLSMCECTQVSSEKQIWQNGEARDSRTLVRKSLVTQCGI